MKNQKTELWILLALTLFCGSSARAEGIEATAKGTPIPLPDQKLGEAVELLAADSESPSIRVKGTAGKLTMLHLFDLDAPVIDAEAYAVVGEVRHEGVKGDGYLEMWNHLPAEKGGKEIGASFFSRTMGDSGPMGKLTGDSGWRPFQLPAFINDGSGRRPLKLTLNVVLPGEGTVEVRALKLRTLRLPSAAKNGPGIPVALAATLGIGCGAGVVGLIWFLKKRRSDSELRRIQAVDS